MIGAPGVYTRVTEYLHWIYNTTHKKNKTKKQRRKNVTPSPARLPSRPQREKNQTPSPVKVPSTKVPSRPLRGQNQTPSIAKLPPSRVQPRPQRRQNQIPSPGRLPPVRVTPRPFVPQTAAPPQTVPPRTIPSRTVAPSIVGTTFNKSNMITLFIQKYEMGWINLLVNIFNFSNRGNRFFHWNLQYMEWC